MHYWFSDNKFYKHIKSIHFICIFQNNFNGNESVINNERLRDEKRVQSLRALTVFPEDLVSIPSTHGSSLLKIWHSYTDIETGKLSLCIKLKKSELFKQVKFFTMLYYFIIYIWTSIYLFYISIIEKHCYIFSHQMIKSSFFLNVFVNVNILYCVILIFVRFKVSLFERIFLVLY